MATQTQELSPESVTDVTTDLGLTSGKSYLLQAITGSRIYLTQLSAAPAEPGGPAHVLLSYQMVELEQDSSGNFYAWGEGSIAVTEA